MTRHTINDYFKPVIPVMRWGFVGILIVLCGSGCILPAGQAATPNNVRIGFTPPALTSPAPEATAPLTPDAPPTATPFPFGLQDALPVMSGICYEAAFDARDQVFVLRNAEDHINFYNLADNSQLCSRPVFRHPFDFRNNAVLAGLWSYGVGCKANHEILGFQRDDSAKLIEIRILFYTEGACNYELVRPFWVGIPDAADYQITIIVDI